jgi:hypothetical protein
MILLVWLTHVNMLISHLILEKNLDLIEVKCLIQLEENHQRLKIKKRKKRSPITRFCMKN